MYFLGVDTSNYVTSVAVVETGPGHKARLHWEKRFNLEVIKGGKGLRQAEAVFQHLRQMPELWQGMAVSTPVDRLKAIGVSDRPRPQEGSYMPVFQVGNSFAQSMAALLHIPCFAFSHQEGHLQVGLWSAKCTATRFLALHLSGGTTEVLEVNNRGGGWLEIKLLGGTSDLNAGQFVDRVGVKLGYSFPAGKYLEELAAGNREGGLKVPVSVRGYDVSFSGPASFVERAVDEGALPAEAARGVEVCLAHSFMEVIRKAAADKGLEHVLVVGGIAANSFIRKRLEDGLPYLHFYFPTPRFAGDSAIGPALLAALRL